MNQRNLKICGQLLVVIFAAVGLKQYYSTASVDQLRWILAPTTFAVEFITGWRFEFETHAGYMSSDRSFIIAASCAGVNFLITAFLMLSLWRLWKVHSQKTLPSLVWRFLPVAAVAAYLTTIAANTVRIAIALWLRHHPLEISWLSPNQLHRVEGVIVYFGFLLLLFIVTEKLNGHDTGRSATTSKHSPALNGRFALIGQCCFPLLIYYAITLGVPLVNGAYRTRSPAGGWEHSAFVLVIPPLIILPLVLLRFYRSRVAAAMQNPER